MDISWNHVYRYWIKTKKQCNGINIRHITSILFYSIDSFRADAIDLGKNCALFVNSALDRESVASYNFNVTVCQAPGPCSPSSRKKRQAVGSGVQNITTYKYNTWRTARVVIIVDDVNDNNPIWTLVPYPNDNIAPLQGTRGIFIAAVDALAPAQTLVTQLTVSPTYLGLTTTTTTNNNKQWFI